MRSKLYDIQTYKPAVYKQLKDDYIRYYALNPDTGKMERIRIRLNHIPERHREKYANHLCNEINAKLMNGWNPFVIIEQKNMTILAACREYMTIKEKELRENSIRAYRSYITKLEQYIIKTHPNGILVRSFNRGMAIGLMNDIFKRKKTKTFNNYMTCYRAFWNWMIEYEYTEKNPFKEISKKKEGEKERTIIDRDTRDQIKKYLEKHDLPFLMICYLIFFCLIRPNEITYLKPTHFKFRGSSIYIPAFASKNGKGAKVTIPDVILEDLENFIKNSQISESDYLFSQINSLLPGRKRLDPREFTRRWSKLRDILEMPKEYQLYSLKDSGIVQMLEDGISPNEVMRQARHEDLATTTKYLRYVTEGSSYQVRKRAKNF